MIPPQCPMPSLHYGNNRNESSKKQKRTDTSQNLALVRSRNGRLSLNLSDPFPSIVLALNCVQGRSVVAVLPGYEQGSFEFRYCTFLTKVH